MNKKVYVERKLHELFKYWLSFITALGVLIFILSGVIVIFMNLPNFKTFVFINSAAASFLLVVFLLTRIFSQKDIAIFRILAYVAILCSALSIEIMILKLGGHASRYFLGMILLGILVIGFIPAKLWFHVTSALLIYCVYFVPIILTDDITNYQMFLVANAFISISFLSALLISYFYSRSLVNEFSLQYDLRQYQEHLKSMIKDRTTELSGAFSQLTGEAAQRAEAEKLIEHQTERQKALRSIDMLIIASRDLKHILDVFLTIVISHLKVDAADVLLLKPEAGILEYAGHRGFNTERIKDIVLQVGKGYAGNVVSGQRKIIISDLADADEKIDTFEDYKFSQGYFMSEEGFKSYIGIPLVAKGNIIGVLEIFHRSELHPDSDWLDFLDSLAAQSAIALDNATMLETLELTKEEILNAYDMTIEALARVLDFRDPETKGHADRVTGMTLEIAKYMGMSDSELQHVRRGAFLHDIGKLAVPDSILFKAGPLTDEEWRINKMHPRIAYEMLSPISFLKPALDIPHCHHERWDGKGYPRGLKGEEIPFAARIFSLVDVWDALQSDRPYRPAWPEDKLIQHIRNAAGTQFDPAVVEAFLSMQGYKIPESASGEPELPGELALSGDEQSPGEPELPGEPQSPGEPEYGDSFYKDDLKDYYFDED